MQMKKILVFLEITSDGTDEESLDAREFHSSVGSSILALCRRVMKKQGKFRELHLCKCNRNSENV